MFVSFYEAIKVLSQSSKVSQELEKINPVHLYSLDFFKKYEHVYVCVSSERGPAQGGGGRGDLEDKRKRPASACS